uniref:Uncharacterized protein n=1 Tax=Heterosigma akashiwo TaxID=2829 RepID=A0A6V1N338_HETAK
MGKYGDEKGSKKRKKKNDFQKEKRKEPISEAYFGFGASPSTGALPQGPGASRRRRLGLAPPLLQLPLLVLRRQLSHQRRHPPGDLVPDWRPLLVREAVRVRQLGGGCVVIALLGKRLKEHQCRRFGLTQMGQKHPYYTQNAQKHFITKNIRILCIYILCIFLGGAFMPHIWITNNA